VTRREAQRLSSFRASRFFCGSLVCPGIAGRELFHRPERLIGASFYGSEVDCMKASHLARLRLLSLAFLLPGLGGLIVSAVFSTHYADTLPRAAAPEEMRIHPRNIHGIIVYQTAQEDRRLSVMEDSSVGVFLVGLTLGLIYLARWGNVRSSELELEDEELAAVQPK
jgi:hypothetical protein